MNDTTTKYSWQIDKYVLIGEHGALNRVWQSASQERALTINYHPHEHRVTVNYWRGELESLLVGGEDMHPLAWYQDRQLYVVQRNQLDGSAVSKFRIHFCSPQDCRSFVNRMPEIWEIRHSEKPALVQPTQAGSVEATNWDDLSVFYNPPQFPPIPQEVQHELGTWAAEAAINEHGEGTSRSDEDDDDSGATYSPLPNALVHFDAIAEPRKNLPSMKPKKRKRPRKSLLKKPKPAAKTSVNGASSSKPKNPRLPTVTNVGDGVVTRRMSVLQASTSGSAADAASTEQPHRLEQNETNTAELLQAVLAILPDEWSAEDVAMLAGDLVDVSTDSMANYIDSTEPTAVDYDDLLTTCTPTMSIGSPDSGAERGGPTPEQSTMLIQSDGAQMEPVDVPTAEPVVVASVKPEHQAVADPHIEKERSESLRVDEDSSPGSIDSQDSASIDLGASIAGPSNFQLLAVGCASPGSLALVKADDDDEEEVCVLSDATIRRLGKQLARSILWFKSLGKNNHGQSSPMTTRSGRSLSLNPSREDASKPPTKRRPPPAKRNGPTAKKRRAVKRSRRSKPHRYELREKRPPSRILSSDEYELSQ